LWNRVTVGRTELTSVEKAAEEALNTEESAEVEKVGRTLKREETVADFGPLLFVCTHAICRA